jgi:hypothetical protein
MPHVLVIGQTGMGKTRLLRAIGRRYRRAGIALLAWTPIPHEFEGIATASYSDLDAFVARVFEHVRCAVFLDEAGEALTPEQIRTTGKLATRSRHLGHSVHFAAQRAAGLVPPLVRDQCELAYVFRIGRSDAEALGNQRGHAELANACTLAPLEYYRVSWDRCEKRVLDAQEEF